MMQKIPLFILVSLIILCIHEFVCHLLATKKTQQSLPVIRIREDCVKLQKPSHVGLSAKLERLPTYMFGKVLPGKDDSVQVECELGEMFKGFTSYEASYNNDLKDLSSIDPGSYQFNHTSYFVPDADDDVKDEEDIKGIEDVIKKIHIQNAQENDDCKQHNNCLNVFSPIFNNDGKVINYKNKTNTLILERMAEIVWKLNHLDVFSSIIETFRFGNNVLEHNLVGSMFKHNSCPCPVTTIPSRKISLSNMPITEILIFLALIYRIKYKATKEDFINNIIIEPHTYKNYNHLNCAANAIGEEISKDVQDALLECYCGDIQNVLSLD